MTDENKLKIVTLSHNIKALCYILDKKTFSEHCVTSGTFTEIDSLFIHHDRNKQPFHYPEAFHQS